MAAPRVGDFLITSEGSYVEDRTTCGGQLITIAGVCVRTHPLAPGQGTRPSASWWGTGRSR